MDGLSTSGPNLYVSQRQGSLLSRGTVLKSDFFPSSELLSSEIAVTGAPNFRQLRPALNPNHINVFAVGQPTITGIRTILNMFNIRQSLDLAPNRRRRVVWINLREEPVVYLNNRSYVLRELSSPFTNLVDFNSITGERLEQIENHLRQEIIDESVMHGLLPNTDTTAFTTYSNHHGNIIVHEETQEGRLRPSWTFVDSDVVQSPAQVCGFLLSPRLTRSF